MREVSGDATLTLQKIEEGSIRLILRSTKEGFDRVEYLFKQGRLANILGFPVQNVNQQANERRASGASVGNIGGSSIQAGYALDPITLILSAAIAAVVSPGIIINELTLSSLIIINELTWNEVFEWFQSRIDLIITDDSICGFTFLEASPSGKVLVIQGIYNRRTNATITSRIIECNRLDNYLAEIHSQQKLVIYE